MIFFGILFLAIAIGCFFAARGQSSQMRAMSAADTFSSQMLQELYDRVVPALGGESLAQVCEVVGVIEADVALSAPLSGQACVAYTRTVTREYEEDVASTDSDGKTTTTVARRSETVENNQQRVRFFVRDTTGRVLIDPEQAELDQIETINRFEAAQPKPGERTRTLGYRYQEQALPIGTQAYVLGCAVDGGDQPMIARSPRDLKQRFMISRRSERELTNAATGAAHKLYYAAGGAGTVGLVLLVLGLARG
jgi:E3 Ubiquitin ligase